MYVSYSGGRQEDVHFDKITSRIQKLCYGLNMDFVDPVISKFTHNLLLTFTLRYLNVTTDCYNYESYQWALPRSHYC